MQSPSISGRIGEARERTKVFLHQEIELAKAEWTEKTLHYRQAATRTGIGALVSCVALLVLLAGLGLLLSFLFQSVGLDLLSARSAGFGGSGLVAVLVGGLVLFKSIKTLSKQSLVPRKTLKTIQRVKGMRSQSIKRGEPEKPQATSKDLESQIIATEARLGRNLEALAARLSPTRFLRKASVRVRANPVRWNLAALLTGFAGSVWFVKKLRR